jgi:hypothetical protein
VTILYSFVFIFNIAKEKKSIYKDIIKNSTNLTDFAKSLNFQNSTIKRLSGSRSSITRSSISKKGRKSTINMKNNFKI